MNTQPVVSTSASRGYLRATNLGGELNDRALITFLQQIVVGVTGMDGTLVRPRWQPEPPNQPDFSIDWAAIGAVGRDSDVFVYEGGNPDSHFVVRQQILRILLSFYGPNSEANTELFGMGMGLAQNREIFTRNGMGLVEVEQSTPPIPEMVNERWVYRMDTPFRVRRSQQYTYQVVSLTGAGIDIIVDEPPSQYPVVVQQA